MCLLSAYQFDYSSVLQVLLEENIQLHILMDQDFVVDKKRLKQVLFGVDKVHAFTKRFLKDPTADKQLRSNVPVPKAALGICAPLAIESNGTIFTAAKMQQKAYASANGRPGAAINQVRKFMTVFARRVAQSAVATDCQTCECSGHDTGTAYMTCSNCNFPSASMFDYGFNEDDMLERLQPGMMDFDFDEEVEDTDD